MKFEKVCNTFNEIEKTASRNEMTDILVNLYKELNEEEAQIISYLIQGRVAPLFVKSEFNYSEKSLLNLLKNIYGNGENPVEKRKEIGDIGETVEYFNKKNNASVKSFTLREIYENLWQIVNTTGTGSTTRKDNIVGQLLQNMTPVEAKFFSRIICGSLRLGVSTKTLLDVFSVSKTEDKSMRDILDRAYGSCADPGMLVNTDWERITTIPGIPVLSRLVSRVGSFEEVFERLGNDVIVQPKFDGLRCQIHKISTKEKTTSYENVIWQKYIKNDDSIGLFDSESTGDVKLFTRNLEDVTDMFPEVVEAARDIKLDSFILDSEILGWNYEKNRFLTYQETMQRRRKYDINKTMENIPVKAMIFDILYLNGEDLLEKDTVDRVRLMEKEFSHTRDGISLSDTTKISNLEDLQDIFDKSVKKGLEGIIVKKLEGGYSPGARNYDWIKLKKSMNKGMVDTVDLVVVGYYKGSGRRKDLGFGALLGAVYNEDRETYEAICKVGTGFDDESIRRITEELENISVDKQPKNVLVVDGLQPDVWIEPQIVFSVESDEISRNISKKTEIGEGLSLRFPRLVEFGRDKNSNEASSVKELLNIYEAQKKLAKNA